MSRAAAQAAAGQVAVGLGNAKAVRAGEPDARSGVARGRASAARDGDGDRRAGRRWHGRVPATPTVEEKGEGVGKHEGRVGKLTAGSIWAEGGRR